MEDEGHKTEEEKLTKTTTIGSCHVYENAKGGLSIAQGAAVCWDRRELIDFVTLATRFLAQSRHEYTQTIFLVGGPYHGEFREIPVSTQILKFPQLDKPSYVADLGVTPGTLEFTDHIYSKVNDIAWDGIRLPFELFEHSSLREANIARAARLLEEELNINDTQQTITKQDLEFRRQDMAKVQVEVEEANRKRNRAVNQLTQSEERRKQTYEDGLRLIAKRRALQFHHGV